MNIMTDNTLRYDPSTVNELIEAFDDAESDEEREDIAEQVLQATVGQQGTVEFYLTLISKAGLKQAVSPSKGLSDAKNRVVDRLGEHQKQAYNRVRQEMANRKW